MGIARESRLSRSKQDQLTEHFVAGIADSDVPPLPVDFSEERSKRINGHIYCPQSSSAPNRPYFALAGF